MGAMQWQGAWLQTTQYGPGDVVTYSGSTFTATDTPAIGTPPPNSSTWAALAVGIVWGGTYDPALSYVTGQAVGHEGSSYVAVQSVPAQNPPPNSTFWNVLAAQGAAGAPGSTKTLRGTWDRTLTYNVGDAVQYDGTDYVATKAPPVGDAPNDTAYWVVLAQFPPAEQSAMNIAAIVSASGAGASALFAALALIPAFKQMLTDPIGNLSTNLTNLTTTVTALTTTVSGLTDQVSGLSSDISSIGSRVGKVEQSVGNLASTVDQVSQDVRSPGGLNDQVRGLNSDVNQLGPATSRTLAQLKQLQTQLTLVTNAMQSLKP